MKVETLRWRDGRLELIDQRILPGRVEYVACDSAAAVASAIRSMVVRGAPAIGCAAAYGIALEARLLERLPAADFAAGLARARAGLAASRPTAVNLAWSLARMQRTLDALRGSAPRDVAARLLAEAHAVAADDIASNRAIGRFGAELIADGARVLTHCNAGALATAGHGTALGVIRSAIEAGKRVSVTASETRPFLQGARLTAWELAEDGIPVTLIADVMAGHLISRGEIDAIVVGADRVAANGDVANKVGTYTLAVLADRHRVPFYVACPLSTIDRATPTGAQIPIEERGAEEVLGFGELRWAPAGVSARNAAFDVTPAALVGALITERGIVHRPNAERIERLFESRQASAKR
ncbi:MAG TPA: S-methyl-5-thioribose-1-phosphate isomerase [Burkholderiales bacterium]|nr:S-methyl-5-thioribose-1-phosphate isomerase [Burkholderiales bacterium]